MRKSCASRSRHCPPLLGWWKSSAALSSFSTVPIPFPLQTKGSCSGRRSSQFWNVTATWKTCWRTKSLIATMSRSGSLPLNDDPKIELFLFPDSEVQPIYLVWRKDRHLFHAAKHFVEIAQEIFR